MVAEEHMGTWHGLTSERIHTQKTEVDELVHA
jgi:hypothetical protein